jgi:hypothetical protein
MAFASNLRLCFSSIPTQDVASEKSISFYCANLAEDIPFELQLSREASKYYRIKPISGILKKNESYKTKITLYAKKEIKQKGSLFNPSLVFNLTFKYKSKLYRVYGAESINSLPYK